MKPASLRMRIQLFLERAVPLPIKFSVGPVPICIEPGWLWIPLLVSEPFAGRFKKRVHGSYNPKRWGGRIWFIEIGSRG